MALLAGAPSAASAAEEGGTAYLFSYFVKNGEDGLHLAWSADGYTWEALGGGRSYLTPKVGAVKLMRDPCLLRGPDGRFHMVWTSGWWENHIGYASSTDLLTWSDQLEIPVMAHEPKVRNTWAPEVVWDAGRKRFLIFWSSTIPGRFADTAGTSESGLNHRMYFTTTADWKSFTRTQLFFDPGFSVIDGTLVAQGGRYHLVVKDETRFPPRKHLRIASALDPEGPWRDLGTPFTRDWVEGPTALNRGAETLLYYDVYRDRRYGVLRSTDLRSWEDVTAKLALPPGIRHGTVLEVPREVVERLRQEPASPIP